jgi:hypothetical protein
LGAGTAEVLGNIPLPLKSVAIEYFGPDLLLRVYPAGMTGRGGANAEFIKITDGKEEVLPVPVTRLATGVRSGQMTHDMVAFDRKALAHAYDVSKLPQSALERLGIATTASKFDYPVVHALPPDVDQTYPRTGSDEFGLPVWRADVVANLQKITQFERAIARLSHRGDLASGEFPAAKAHIDEAIRSLGLEGDAANRARVRLSKAFEQLGALAPENASKQFDVSAVETNEGLELVVVRRSSDVFGRTPEGRHEGLVEDCRIVAPSGTIFDGFTLRPTGPLPDGLDQVALGIGNIDGLKQEIARLKQEIARFEGPPGPNILLPTQLEGAERAIQDLELAGKGPERMREGVLKAALQLGLDLNPAARFDFLARREEGHAVVLLKNGEVTAGARIVTPTGAVFDGFTGMRTDLP